MSQNSGITGLTSEVPVLWMGQTLKTSDTIILPDVADNNQPVPQPIECAYNCKFSINKVEISLVSVQVYTKKLPSIAKIVARALEFGGDSTSRGLGKLHLGYT